VSSDNLQELTAVRDNTACFNASRNQGPVLRVARTPADSLFVHGRAT